MGVHTRLVCLFFVMLLVFGSPADAQPALIVDAFPHLTFNHPLFFASAGDGTRRVFVVEQGGFIKVFPNDSAASRTATFLDLSRRISSSSGEEGLLGLAFPADFRTSGRFYVNFTAFKAGTSEYQVVVARYDVSRTDPDSADPSSETVLLQIDKPYANHNGGMLAFGPDGNLYIGVGDGGWGNDPFNNGQSRSTLLGKILRIDVSGVRGYKVPPDNPFAGNTSGWREEIWAYGLRNPWRFSFDAVTGRLWAGDVGQGAREEVDIVVKGGNYGWSNMEGRICRPGGGSCDSTGLLMPVKDYGHDLGICVTGGYVYRGTSLPDLAGAYIYGDFGSGRIWMLRYEDGRVTQDTLLAVAGTLVSSFGVDEQSELYFTGWSDGKIYRFARRRGTENSVILTSPQPALLQQNKPNPASARTSVSFRVVTPGPVVVRVFDVLGRKVITAIDGPMEAGQHTVSINTSPLASGIYYYSLETPSGTEIKRMVVVR